MSNWQLPGIESLGVGPWCGTACLVKGKLCRAGNREKNLSIKIKQKLAIHGEAISGFPSSLPSTHRKAFAIGKAGLSS